MDFKDLDGMPRLLMEIELEPIQGDRFQPTGFADLGAAVYQGPSNKRMLLVESAQSVANRLEQTCLDGNGPRIAKAFEGLPYIVAKLTGATDAETSSLVEAHRINSPYIISNSEFKESFKNKASYSRGQPLNWKKIAAALFYYDPNALLHGAFMANLDDGRIKVPRALTGFIEAEGVREAASGGVKNNLLDPTGKIRAENYNENVYGNVPYHRMEYTADRIVAYFNFDLALLEGYGLEPEARDLLVALGLYKIKRFLSNGLRLRTACDLKPRGTIKMIAPDKFTLPEEKVLLAAVQKGIEACTVKGLFSVPPVTEIITKVVQKKTEGEEAGTEAA
ncbi:MAG: type I-U CRISPR-associated RAMP protein Csb1/Cas7u [Methanothrix sp.]|nr:type I-U CRISPR-associated RAMP protein Csb1/Cas7u [Methanothrix sp.]